MDQYSAIWEQECRRFQDDKQQNRGLGTVENRRKRNKLYSKVWLCGWVALRFLWLGYDVNNRAFRINLLRSVSTEAASLGMFTSANFHRQPHRVPWRLCWREKFSLSVLTSAETAWIEPEQPDSQTGMLVTMTYYIHSLVFNPSDLKGYLVKRSLHLGNCKLPLIYTLMFFEAWIR